MLDGPDSCPLDSGVYFPFFLSQWLVRALGKVMADSGVIGEAREGTKSLRVPRGGQWEAGKRPPRARAEGQGSE